MVRLVGVDQHLLHVRYAQRDIRERGGGASAVTLADGVDMDPIPDLECSASSARHETERTEDACVVGFEQAVLVLLAALPLSANRSQPTTLELGVRRPVVGPRHPWSEVLETFSDGACDGVGVLDAEPAQRRAAEVDALRCHQIPVSTERARSTPRDSDGVLPVPLAAAALLCKEVFGVGSPCRDRRFVGPVADGDAGVGASRLDPEEARLALGELEHAGRGGVVLVARLVVANRREDHRPIRRVGRAYAMGMRPLCRTRPRDSHRYRRSRRPPNERTGPRRR